VQLLTNLGLDYKLDIDVEGTHWTEERRIAARGLAQCAEVVNLSKAEKAAHILEAHESLSSVSDTNAARFLDVVRYLTEDLGQKQAK
jgi:hypothetical protein